MFHILPFWNLDVINFNTNLILWQKVFRDLNNSFKCFIMSGGVNSDFSQELQQRNQSNQKQKASK